MEKLKNHTLKITIWGIATMAIFLIVWSIKLWWFISVVDANTTEISVIKTDMKALNNTIIETRNDVKWLVTNEKNK